jgi:AAA15 family ATPase/GTPase
MILEVRLANFFSIKDEVVLDLRGVRLNSAQARALEKNIISEDKMAALKSVILFGANASGKSNIIKAMRFCFGLILNSQNNHSGTVFMFQPFKYDGFTERPSSFFIRLLIDNVEYEYSFTLNRTRIISETLRYYPHGRVSKVFSRDELTGSSKKEKYQFGSQISRPLDIAESTSEKTLFLSRAAQMDREIARILYDYFYSSLIQDLIPLEDPRTDQIFKNHKEIIISSLRNSGSDITDIYFAGNHASPGGTLFHINEPAGVYSVSHRQEIPSINIVSYHKSNKELPFNFISEESAGTIKLFRLLITVIDAAANNRILIIDELDQHLHPLLTEYILQLFHESSSAQLISSMHSTFLLDLKKLRKDQIYFCSKKDDASTDLYSLADFTDFRETMDAEKAYLMGRFSAVPLTGIASMR